MPTSTVMRASQAADPAAARPSIRQLANQVFSRASGAPLREGNRVRLLKDAAGNYPAWLDAIGAARRTIHFEMYIIHEDDQGRLFADALVRKAAEGVQVRLLYDWMGGFGKTSRGFWNRLRAGGVDVRCYNPPRFDRPLGWISRDHRKSIVVDGTVAYVTGLCVGRAWVGDPARGADPWRDTGIELRGPAVADVEAAFADAWASCGDPLPAAAGVDALPRQGDVTLRVVATVPNTGGLFRVDQLVAAMARSTLWLTDAYYGGTSPYVHALRAAAQDGVDVRLLVPGSSDIPVIRPFSRAGYRPLLEAGVRVFEWNGSMIHAKTAVADRRWARVGSTNLNIASWMGNRELDVIVENEAFADEMQEMFLADLSNATEVVLERNRVRAPGSPRGHRRPVMSGGSSGRVVAGAVRVGNTVAAAISNTRVLESVEANIAVVAGAVLAGLAVLAATFPRGIAYPIAVFAGWMGAALLWRGIGLYRRRRRSHKSSTATKIREMKYRRTRPGGE
jgi:cardiolipin synthase